jgi:hypothetical protein
VGFLHSFKPGSELQCRFFKRTVFLAGITYSFLNSFLRGFFLKDGFDHGFSHHFPNSLTPSHCFDLDLVLQIQRFFFANKTLFCVYTFLTISMFYY